MFNILNLILSAFNMRLIRLSKITEDISDLDIYRDIYKQKLMADSEVVTKLFMDHCDWADRKNGQEF
jgi:hypothetical protein